MIFIMISNNNNTLTCYIYIYIHICMCMYIYIYIYIYIQKAPNVPLRRSQTSETAAVCLRLWNSHQISILNDLLGNMTNNCIIQIYITI